MDFKVQRLFDFKAKSQDEVSIYPLLIKLQFISMGST